MNLINIEKITKAYTDRKLFDNASFSLQEGEKIGVIGINGTGKTTLLKMISGLAAPSSGDFTLFGFKGKEKAYTLPVKTSRIRIS